MQNPRPWLNASALCANWPERRSTTFFSQKVSYRPGFMGYVTDA